MKKVQRSEVLDIGAYEEIRPRFRQRIIEAKQNRRVAVGDHMTFIFENHDTVLFQIQEMIRTERITKESGIEHEIETYNDLVPGDGELFATLMIEYEPEGRREKLDALRGLKDHVFLVVGDRRVQGQFEVLPGEEVDRVPSINYVRFAAGRDAAALLRDGGRPAALEVDHPSYTARTDLAPPVRRELAEDLETP
ncbi:MAG: DUF3501 family protein [Myxococcota bacterium]